MKNESILKDVLAGFQVALIALPLSIGIALASGAPASAGLIAAIIGGILGSWTGGGHININGPAAGLIVIVLGAINQLGFQGMLAAACVAGIIQILFGILRLGSKGSAFPSSVIHGMMCAIGIIIIAKQAHLTIGHVPQAQNPLLLLLELPFSFKEFNHQIAIIGVATVVFLIGWNKISSGVLKKIPGPLIAVIFGSLLAQFIDLPQKALLNVPAELSSWFFFPDFSKILSTNGMIHIMTLTLVGSLETTLSASAVDKIDPFKRKSDLDKDLISKGICNVLSSLVGGLPMIAEIVRSSANVTYGAQSWRSNFFHGVFILVAVLTLPFALNLIPVASLAGVLCLVGWRLGSPEHFKHALQIGKDNVVGFIVTLIVTLLEDLLLGILAGVLAQYIAEIIMGLKLSEAFKARFQINSQTDKEIIQVQSALIFSNFLKIKDHVLQSIENNKDVQIDLRECPYIDHSVMEQLSELREIFKAKNKKFEWLVSPEHKRLGRSALSARKKK